MKTKVRAPRRPNSRTRADGDSPNAPASPPGGVRSCAGRMGTLGTGKKYLLVVTQERRTDTDSQRERASMTNRRSIPT